MLYIDIRILTIIKIYPAAMSTLTAGGGPQNFKKIICTPVDENISTKKNF